MTDEPSAFQILSADDHRLNGRFPCNIDDQMRGAPRPGSGVHVRVLLLMCAVLLCAPSAFTLDPNKRVTQYIHAAWRVQDGSLPAGMYHLVQTSDGFLWFLSLPADLYRFDGVRFLLWRLPEGVSIDRSMNIFADNQGGLLIF